MTAVGVGEAAPAGEAVLITTLQLGAVGLWVDAGSPVSPITCPLQGPQYDGKFPSKFDMIREIHRK